MVNQILLRFLNVGLPDSISYYKWNGADVKNYSDLKWIKFLPYRIKVLQENFDKSGGSITFVSTLRRKINLRDGKMSIFQKENRSISTSKSVSIQ